MIEKYSAIGEMGFSKTFTFDCFDRPRKQLAPRILISGPPGSGKRRLALEIAEMAGLESLLVRISMLFASKFGKRFQKFEAMMERAEMEDGGCAVIFPDADVFSNVIASAHLNKFGTSWFIATSDSTWCPEWGIQEGFGYMEREQGQLWVKKGLFNLHYRTPLVDLGQVEEDLRPWINEGESHV